MTYGKLVACSLLGTFEMSSSSRQYDIDFFTNFYVSNESDKGQLSYSIALVAGFSRSSTGPLIILSNFDQCGGGLADLLFVQRPEKCWLPVAMIQLPFRHANAGASIFTLRIR